MLIKGTVIVCYLRWIPTMSIFMTGGVMMFKYRPIASQLRDAQKKNIKLQQETMQNKADLEFVAIRCDVEIPEDDEEEE